MKKYKYSRKEIVNYMGEMGWREQFRIGDMLLETIPVEKCRHQFTEVGDNCVLCGESSITNTIQVESKELSVNGGTCVKCGEKNCQAVGPNIHKCKQPKTKEVKHLDKLVVPEKINFSLKKENLHSIELGTTFYDLWLKQCEIIDYLISLQKEK